jgi:hypothetical protein
MRCVFSRASPSAERLKLLQTGLWGVSRLRAAELACSASVVASPMLQLLRLSLLSSCAASSSRACASRVHMLQGCASPVHFFLAVAPRSCYSAGRHCGGSGLHLLVRILFIFISRAPEAAPDYVTGPPRHRLRLLFPFGSNAAMTTACQQFIVCVNVSK